MIVQIVPNAGQFKGDTRSEYLSIPFEGKNHKATLENAASVYQVRWCICKLLSRVSEEYSNY